MFRNGRRLPPPPLARGVGVGLYLGAMLETGVNATARALPPSCFVFFVLRANCASVVLCFFFFAFIVRLLQIVWPPAC